MQPLHCNPAAKRCQHAPIRRPPHPPPRSYLHASRLHASSADATEMYPPGRLLYLRPFKGAAPKQTVWDAVWVDPRVLMGEGILLSPSMMAHHRMFVVREAFESALAREAETRAAPLAVADSAEDVLFADMV